MRHTAPERRRRDEGAVLPLVLVLMVVGSLVLVALLAFAGTLLRTRPPLEARSDSLEAVRSAMRLAAVAQTTHGTEGCFNHDDGNFDINGRQVQISCSQLERTDEEGSRLSVITTDNRLGFSSNGGPITMVGDSFFAGGDLATTAASISGGDTATATGYASQPPSVRPAANYRYTTVADTAIALGSNDCAPVYGGAVREFDYTGPLYSADNPTQVVPIDATLLGLADLLLFDLTTLDIDTSTAGVQKTLTVVGEGEWTVDGIISVTFVPEPGFLGDPSSIGFEVAPLIVGPVQSGTITLAPLVREPQPAFVELLPTDEFTVLPDTAAGTRALGIFVSDEAGGWVLHRPADPTAPFAFSPTVPTSADVRLCYQQVPGTDPAFIPFDRTFCASPLVDNPGGLDCGFDPWWTSAGRQPALGAPYQYPYLPELPTVARNSGVFEQVRPDCRLLYPGRYASNVVLAGDTNYYLASGTYLFEADLKIEGNARVVAGNGTVQQGCADDADGAFPSDGSSPTIDPQSGATLLLGQDGRIIVNNASLVVNERIFKTEAAPIGVSVMSVNVQTPTNDDAVDVEIPYTDRVLRESCATTPRSDPSAECDITTYTNGGETYVPSNWTADEPIIDISNAQNVEFAGAVFTPNAKIVVTSNPASTGSVRFSLGATASRIEIDADQPSDVTFGRISETEYQKVQLTGSHSFTSSTSGSTSTVESRMVIELDKNKRYAINSWTIETR